MIKGAAVEQNRERFVRPWWKEQIFSPIRKTFGYGA
jgi:activator of HSP90 ATPase